MTLRHLEIFLSVCKTRNMTRTAEELYMTQPAVTRAIKELETEYGVILFERFRHQLALTPEGKEVYEHFLHIKEQLDLMEKEIGNPEGRRIVRIGASITLGNFLMPELIKKLESEYPNVSFYVRIGRGNTITKLLHDNDIDIGFIEKDIDDPDLISQKISTNELVLLTNPKHPLATKPKIRLKDVMNYPILLRQKGSVGREFVDSVLITHGFNVEPKWESASTQAIVRAVGANIGVALLPDKLIHNAGKRGEISARHISDVDLHRNNNIVYHKNKYLSPLLKKVMSEAIKLAKMLEEQSIEWPKM